MSTDTGSTSSNTPDFSIDGNYDIINSSISCFEILSSSDNESVLSSEEDDNDEEKEEHDVDNEKGEIDQKEENKYRKNGSFNKVNLDINDSEMMTTSAGSWSKSLSTKEPSLDSSLESISLVTPLASFIKSNPTKDTKVDSPPIDWLAWLTEKSTEWSGLSYPGISMAYSAALSFSSPSPLKYDSFDLICMVHEDTLLTSSALSTSQIFDQIHAQLARLAGPSKKVNLYTVTFNNLISWYPKPLTQHSSNPRLAIYLFDPQILSSSLQSHIQTVHFIAKDTPLMALSLSRNYSYNSNINETLVCTPGMPLMKVFVPQLGNSMGSPIWLPPSVFDIINVTTTVNSADMHLESDVSFLLGLAFAIACTCKPHAKPCIISKIKDSPKDKLSFHDTAIAQNVNLDHVTPVLFYLQRFKSFVPSFGYAFILKAFATILSLAALYYILTLRQPCLAIINMNSQIRDSRGAYVSWNHKPGYQYQIRIRSYNVDADKADPPVTIPLPDVKSLTSTPINYFFELPSNFQTSLVSVDLMATLKPDWSFLELIQVSLRGDWNRYLNSVRLLQTHAAFGSSEDECLRDYYENDAETVQDTQAANLFGISPKGYALRCFYKYDVFNTRRYNSGHSNREQRRRISYTDRARQNTVSIAESLKNCFSAALGIFGEALSWVFQGVAYAVNTVIEVIFNADSNAVDVWKMLEY